MQIDLSVGPAPDRAALLSDTWSCGVDVEVSFAQALDVDEQLPVELTSTPIS